MAWDIDHGFPVIMFHTDLRRVVERLTSFCLFLIMPSVFQDFVLHSVNREESRLHPHVHVC